MDAVKGEAAMRANDQGTYKDEYSKCFWVGYGTWGIWSDETDITFDLRGAYNSFSATIYGRSTKTDIGLYYVAIFEDGKSSTKTLVLQIMKDHLKYPST